MVTERLDAAGFVIRCDGTGPKALRALRILFLVLLPCFRLSQLSCFPTQAVQSARETTWPCQMRELGIHVGGGKGGSVRPHGRSVPWTLGRLEYLFLSSATSDPNGEERRQESE